MTTSDTILLEQNTEPFYQWGAYPDAEEAVPDVGVAACDTFNLYFLPDSTLKSIPMERPSLFQEHSFVKQHDDLQARVDSTAPVWVFGVLIALVALTTLYYRNAKLRFGSLVPSLFDSRAMDRTLRNNNFNSRSRFVPMGLLMLSGLMLAVHQTALVKTGFWGYLLLVAATAALYLLRNGLMRLLAVIFNNSDAVGTYINSNYLYHLALNTMQLPLLFLMIYLPTGRTTVMYVLGIIVVLELTIRLFRGLKLFLTQSSGPYIYLFYYLCIVEVTPFLVLLKWIIGW